MLIDGCIELLLVMLVLFGDDVGVCGGVIEME